MNRSRWRLIGFVLVLALGRILYDLLVNHHLEQTAALFIGLPAILAIAFASTSPARSATGMILRGMTIALLLSGIVVGEGLICIIFAAPLFYAIGLAIGLTLDYCKRRDRSHSGNAMYGLVIIPFLLLSVEGVNDHLAFPRDESVVEERVVPAGAMDVERMLGAMPRFDKTLPLVLRVGFPIPTGGGGEGLRPGDHRVVHFAAPKGRTADLILTVAERGAGMVRFRPLSDRTPIARWLQWQEAEVRWTGLDVDHTLVRWTLRYRRRLDPAWYFAPLERIAVQGAADYLIVTLAMPR